MRRSTLISCDAQGLGQGRAFKFIHMNNRKKGYVEDFFAHFLFQHQGRPKLKEKKILDSSSMFIKRPTLISLDARVLNKQRDKAMCAWLHALSRKGGTHPTFSNGVMMICAAKPVLQKERTWFHILGSKAACGQFDSSD